LKDCWGCSSLTIGLLIRHLRTHFGSYILSAEESQNVFVNMATKNTERVTREYVLALKNANLCKSDWQTAKLGKGKIFLGIFLPVDTAAPEHLVLVNKTRTREQESLFSDTNPSSRKAAEGLSLYIHRNVINHDHIKQAIATLIFHLGF